MQIYRQKDPNFRSGLFGVLKAHFDGMSLASGAHAVPLPNPSGEEA